MKYSWLLIFCFCCTSAFAQSNSFVDPAVEANNAKNRIDENMVTMGSLIEAMANNLGQLHYLRTLCFSDDDQTWRNVASSMMALEAPQAGARRSQLVSAFNAGYYEQKERYQRCTKTVTIDVAALSENGRRLATMLGDPYRER